MGCWGHRQPLGCHGDAGRPWMRCPGGTTLKHAPKAMTLTPHKYPEASRAEGSPVSSCPTPSGGSRGTRAPQTLCPQGLGGRAWDLGSLRLWSLRGAARPESGPFSLQTSSDLTLVSKAATTPHPESTPPSVPSEASGTPLPLLEHPIRANQFLSAARGHVGDCPGGRRPQTGCSPWAPHLAKGNLGLPCPPPPSGGPGGGLCQKFGKSK